MQILEQNNTEYEILIETLDDLWVLSQFISLNDKVFGTSMRKVKIGGENSTKQVKKLIFVDLLVKKTNFESGILKISGIIQNETEFTAIGQNHTLNYNIKDKIKLKKTQILKFEEKLLKRAVETKNSHNLLVLLDKDSLIVTEFTQFSYSVIFEKSGLGSKKRHLENINEEKEKFDLLEELLKRDYSTTILAGPNIFKDKLQKFILDKIGKKTSIFTYPEVSSHAIDKVIQQITKSGLLTQSELAKEEELIEELLKNINLNQKFTYSFDNTKNDILEGKVEKLLISTKYIEKRKDEETFEELNELMRNVEQLNGELFILNSKNQPAKVLDGLGGIGGILRY